MITAAFFFAPVAVHAAEPASAEITAAVDDAVARYRLPGIAVGIVQGGEVRQIEVRGELAAGSGEPVDAGTLFKIASNTKAMTGALLARLVDQGRLQWKDPVVRHLPAFRMHDDWVTREIQVRDLLIHNSGLGAGAGDLMLWPEPNHFTRADVIHGLRHLRPIASFRSEYAYDNTLYIVAGEVAAAAGGAPYDALLRREVFAPLGMARCQIGEWQRDAVGNIARPHYRRGDAFVAADADPAVIADMPMAAAGGVRCSLDDMLRWAAAWLALERGDAGGASPWLSDTQRDAAWTPHTLMPLSRRMRQWDNSHYSGYGYGWRLTDVDGTRKVSHTGTLSGMYSSLTLLPDLDAGIVVLINADADEARTVLTQTLVKQFTASQLRPAVAMYAGLLAAERADASAGQGAVAARPPQPEPVAVPAGELPGLDGRWRDPWFGDVDICPQPDGGLRFASHKSPRLAGAVMRSDDRLLVRWDDRGIETDAWLLPPAPDAARGAPLRMAKLDPEADFSYDFEDLAFIRSGDCRVDRGSGH
ncbi:serine hydrolase [Luteimonas sp. BDR2-5]|nr:serine hydrolase [Luteimonas sp. BDR2-5]